MIIFPLDNDEKNVANLRNTKSILGKLPSSEF